MRVSPLPLLALCAATACADPGVKDVTVDAAAVELHPGHPEGREAGRLRYRAGFHLTSGAAEFGGFSGLVVLGDGRMLAVSDRGYWLEAELRTDAGGTLVGVGVARMGPLWDEDGKPVESRERRDAEEIRVLPELGCLVSFEGDHRFALYPSDSGGGRPALAVAPRPHPFPSAIGAAGENNGMEAVAQLGDGRLLAVAEGAWEGADVIRAWAGPQPDGRWEAMTLPVFGTYKPTGAATLPSGDPLLLERSYTEDDGVTRIRLSRIEAATIAAGAHLEPVELARLEPPLTVDNMEAVAVREGPAGEVFVYLLSDDNYSDDQRTLLMQFELVVHP